MTSNCYGPFNIHSELKPPPVKADRWHVKRLFDVWRTVTLSQKYNYLRYNQKKCNAFYVLLMLMTICSPIVLKLFQFFFSNMCGVRFFVKNKSSQGCNVFKCLPFEFLISQRYVQMSLCYSSQRDPSTAQLDDMSSALQFVTTYSRWNCYVASLG